MGTPAMRIRACPTTDRAHAAPVPLRREPRVSSAGCSPSSRQAYNAGAGRRFDALVNRLVLSPILGPPAAHPRCPDRARRRAAGRAGDDALRAEGRAHRLPGGRRAGADDGPGPAADPDRTQPGSPAMEGCGCQSAELTVSPGRQWALAAGGCGLPFDASRRQVHPCAHRPDLAAEHLESRFPLDRPFTRAMARASGVERSARVGCSEKARGAACSRRVRCRDGAGHGRARATAVALVVRREAIAVDRTAAWVHGIDVAKTTADQVHPVEVVSPGRTTRYGLGSRRRLDQPRHRAHRRIPADHTAAHSTGPRSAAPSRAGPRRDGRTAGMGAVHARAARRRFPNGRSPRRRPAARAGRAGGCPFVRVGRVAPRLHWHRGRSAMAVLRCRSARPGVWSGSASASSAASSAPCSHQVSADHLVALEGAGWRVVLLRAERVLRTSSDVLTRHLEREFHQQLLAQAG